MKMKTTAKTKNENLENITKFVRRMDGEKIYILVNFIIYIKMIIFT